MIHRSRMFIRSTNMMMIGRHCCDERDLNKVIRNAQAAEIFRSSFLDGSRSNNRISVSDIDEVVQSERVRPSVMIGALETTGYFLGTIARFAPKQLSETISNVVNDATIQQFNDIVRDMHSFDEKQQNIDAKETIKYHRDLETITTEATQDKSKIDSTVLAASGMLSNCLKLTRDV